MLVYWCSPIRVHWMSPHSHWLCIITFGPLQSIWLRFQLPIRSLRCVFPLLYTSELASGVRLSNTNQQTRLWYWYPLLFSLRCWSTTWPQYILLVSTLGCLLLPWPELNLFLYLHILSEGQFVYKWHSAVVYQRFYFGGLDLDSLFCHLFCPPQFPLSCIFPRSLFYPLVIQAILVCFSSLCSFLFNITKQETKKHESTDKHTTQSLHHWGPNHHQNLHCKYSLPLSRLAGHCLQRQTQRPYHPNPRSFDYYTHIHKDSMRYHSPGWCVRHE